ncbi:hypothetical protein HFC64_04410 [Saccharolobus solfataricus]|uniref:Uncharacterized protein n=2 Tax=Saccharolobus solfataricus TaxID=2287 RepID=Q7LXG8_SACS2|nr:hypothetical protein [Saccharolobus solfataricus]AAK41104.1 Hypothetical protein SSO0805 [Saccharolobus solfataricus P2]QPG49200.1 hypothetical protein HFC64_04410 [Saccharolobus solfataricus]CAB57498.1 hypothetical protein [Saccharolobus solfataricus P2]SAI84400.1 Acidianus two-tailed virus, uncharacterised protein ATV_gp39 [Saccharolobus solfataricus]
MTGQKNSESLVGELVNQINELYLSNPNQVLMLAKQAGIENPTFLATPPTKPSGELSFAKLSNIAEIVTKLENYGLPSLLRQYFMNVVKNPVVLNNVVETYYKIAKIIPKEVENEKPLVIENEGFASKSIPPVVR